MKKVFVILGIFLFTSIQLMAQKEYKLAKTNGKLVLNNISNLSVEGYDGKEIVFTLLEKGQKNDLSASDNDPRAEGLSALNNSGFDNTGLGLTISEKGSETMVSRISSPANSEIKIRMPNTVALSINNSGWPIVFSDSTSISLSNLKNEIDISVQFENCKLTNVTGPLSIKTLSGNIELVLKDNFTGPVTVYSVRGFIDMTIGNLAKADLVMNTMREGTIFADKNLKLESKKEKTGNPGLTDIKADSIDTDQTFRTITIHGAEMGAQRGVGTRKPTTTVTLPYSGTSTFSGTLNGGGEKIVLQSMSGNIYLRK